MDYPTKNLYNEKIDINDEKTIYYFTNYYQWDKVKNLPETDSKRLQSDRIFTIKNCCKKYYGYFAKCIMSHFKEFEGENWNVCTVPGHDQTEVCSNSMDKFLSEVCFPKNIKPVIGTIVRCKAMPIKHGSDYGSRTVEKDLESFTGNTRNIIDRNFIIFDDITTSGSSLEAARQFLKRRGANKVVCIALGKTVDDYYYGGDISNFF